MTREVWLLIQEAESGSLAHGSPYCVLSTHATEAGADAARDAWRKEHEFPDDADNDWCNCHGEGVTVDGPHTISLGEETKLADPDHEYLEARRIEEACDRERVVHDPKLKP